MLVIVGRVTANELAARTLQVGQKTFTLKPDVWLQGIEIGTSVSVTYEESKGHRLAVVVRRII